MSPRSFIFVGGEGGGGVANTVNGQRSQNHHCSADSGDAVQQSGRLSFLQLLTICHCPVWSILNCQHENAFKRRSKAAWPSQSCSLTQNPHAVIYVSSSSVIFLSTVTKTKFGVDYIKLIFLITTTTTTIIR